MRAAFRSPSQLWLRSSALVVGLCCGLLLAEGVVRVLGLGSVNITRGALHQYHPAVGWICTPNLDARYQKPGSFDVAIHCNSQGARSREELPFDKPHDERRIVVLGDSAIWGWGLEDDETVPSRIGALLGGTPTINLGANGYNGVQSLVRLQTDGVRYQPDLVVHAFCVNDLDTNFDDKRGGRPIARLDENGALRIENSPVRRPWKAPFKQYLRHNSRLFGLAEYGAELWKVEWKAFRANRLRSDQLAQRESPAARGSATGREDEQQGEVNVGFLDLYAPPGALVDRVWNLEREILRRMQQESERVGAELIVLYVSSRAETSPGIFRETAIHYGIDPDGPTAPDLDVDRPRQRMEEICRELGIPFVDPTQRFREAADPEVLFLPGDPHWSARGADLAAREVVERIITDGH